MEGGNRRKIQRKCVKCQEKFNEEANTPKKLPCGDTMCTMCIYSSLEEDGQIICYTCHQIVLEDPESLPINHIIVKFLRNVERDSKMLRPVAQNPPTQQDLKCIQELQERINGISMQNKMSRNELSHYTTAPVLQQRNITDNTPAMHVPLHSMQIADPIFAFNQNINSNKVQSNYGLQNVPLNQIGRNPPTFRPSNVPNEPKSDDFPSSAPTLSANQTLPPKDRITPFMLIGQNNPITPAQGSRILPSKQSSQARIIEIVDYVPEGDICKCIRKGCFQRKLMQKGIVRDYCSFRCKRVLGIQD